MNFFVYDNVNYRIKIDDYLILLVSEFKDLWDESRNKSKLDTTGKKRLRAYQELTYIYLMLDYKSPYFEYLESEKREAALLDTGLTLKDLDDELFKKAYIKYNEMQDADRILSLIKIANNTLYKMQVFLDNIDFNDVDDQGKPLYKPSDVIKDIKSIAEIRNQLVALEIEHKKGLGGKTSLRGGATPGFMDA